MSQAGDTQLDALRAENEDLRAQLAEVRQALAAGQASPTDGAGELGWWFPEMIDRAPVGILVSDLKGRFIKANQAIQKMLGYTEAEFKELHYKDWTHPEDLERIVALIDSVKNRERESFRVEKRSYHKDGSVRWVSLTFALLRDPQGRPHFSLSLAEDITERKLALDTLRANEDHYRRLVERSPELIAVHLDGRFVYVNPAGVRLLGYSSADELIGKPILDVVHPEEHEQVKDRNRRANAEGEIAPPKATRLIARDGSLFDAEVFGMRISYEGRLAMMVVARDIREQKREEEALRAQNDKLRELDALKGQFVGMVSHELRTPLTSIKGYAEFLEDGVGGELAEPHVEFVRQISRNAERLELLVDDLLDFARINAGTFTVKREPVDVRALVVQAVESVGLQAAEARLTLEMVVPDVPIEVMADPRRIEQVLTNLLTNALKFTAAGGRVTVQASLEVNGVRLEVKDTGVGIAADDQQKIFQRFLQLDSSNTRVAPGVGLGLSICKTIVEAHAGDIGVESEPGRGSTFWFTLPVSK